MTKLIIVPLEITGAAPEWLRILPLGKVQLRDGRQAFEVDAASLDAIVKNFKAGGVDLVVDYEHQSLGPDKAPAAGWIKDLQARPDGLYAKIDWTATALQHIKLGEYRYYSPVLRMDPETRRPEDLMHAALTNVPAIKGLAPLLAAKYGGEAEEPEVIRGSRLVAKAASETQTKSQAQAEGLKKREDEVMKSKLLEVLGLKAEATDDEVVKAVEAGLKKVDSLPEIAETLGLKAEATVSEIKGTVMALKQGQDQFSKLQDEVKALKAENSQGKAEAVVNEAMKDGKIQPFQKEWALKYAAEDPTGFAAYVQTALKMVPTGDGFKTITSDAATAGGLDPEAMAVCKQLNLTPEAFKAQRQAQKEG